MNVTDDYNYTPLLYSLYNENANVIVPLLLKAGDFVSHRLAGDSAKSCNAAAISSGLQTGAVVSRPPVDILFPGELHRAVAVGLTVTGAVEASMTIKLSEELQALVPTKFFARTIQ